MCFCTSQSLPPRGRCRVCEADEVPPGEKPCGAWICGGLVRCINEQKTANFVQQKLELHDIVFILLEIVARRAYGFYFEHFILSCFASHIRKNSMALIPHPPLRGPPSPSTEKAFTFAVPCQGCHRHLALARPRSRGKAFRLRSSSQFFQRLLQDKKKKHVCACLFFYLVVGGGFSSTYPHACG